MYRDPTYMYRDPTVIHHVQRSYIHVQRSYCTEQFIYVMYRDPTYSGILFGAVSIFCLIHCFIAKSMPSLEFFVSFYDSCNHKNV